MICICRYSSYIHVRCIFNNSVWGSKPRARKKGRKSHLGEIFAVSSVSYHFPSNIESFLIENEKGKAFLLYSKLLFGVTHVKNDCLRLHLKVDFCSLVSLVLYTLSTIPLHVHVPRLVGVFFCLKLRTIQIFSDDIHSPRPLNDAKTIIMFW
jgi:hypothetical protein